ncbi:hypothetical protein HUT18_31870 [Streptomyces sp. NA04227]|uniref:hypothetical protein n=1 Tax=Streptomyces sp. NA04227 TaxID=2742136 RepID=UPI0015914769|nr:hypothetical protein [Streptomyces sp. NA04227]QKW10325.1 hypothetical protein HUT18_31870 [Streptomyces sp. NA04227]
MRAIRVASAALLGVSALTLTAPGAVADSPHKGDERFEVAVNPMTVKPGGEVRLTADGCKGRTKVHSGVFDTVVIEAGNNSATTKVDWDARKGATYSVTFSCERDITRTVELTIGKGRPGGHDGRDDQGRPGDDWQKDPQNDWQKDKDRQDWQNDKDGEDWQKEKDGQDWQKDKDRDDWQGRPDDMDGPGHDGQHQGRHPEHGVNAGAGGAFGGLDLHELGLGALLVAGTLGTAYHFSRRRADES